MKSVRTKVLRTNALLLFPKLEVVCKRLASAPLVLFVFFASNHLLKVDLRAQLLVSRITSHESLPRRSHASAAPEAHKAQMPQSLNPSTLKTLNPKSPNAPKPKPINLKQ